MTQMLAWLSVGMSCSQLILVWAHKSPLRSFRWISLIVLYCVGGTLDGVAVRTMRNVTLGCLAAELGWKLWKVLYQSKETKYELNLCIDPPAPPFLLVLLFCFSHCMLLMIYFFFCHVSRLLSIVYLSEEKYIYKKKQKTFWAVIQWIVTAWFPDTQFILLWNWEGCRDGDFKHRSDFPGLLSAIVLSLYKIK